MPDASAHTAVRTATAPADQAAPDAESATAIESVLKERFGLADFRGPQRGVIEAVCAGQDALVVMPTGAGKSLCYQLPALVREGCAVVISPLIALMEDQVQKLNAQGIRAEAIHSGRDRNELRAACRRYLDGELDLMYVAPERFANAQFTPFLKRKPPALIAVDEAHCISKWGHDFRPDYRKLKNHIKALRPSPVIALTATATRRVQRDIARQLDLEGAHQAIAGFRRDNIAVEIVNCLPKHRNAKVADLLADDALRPAIVYAPTRKKVEALAEELAAGGLHANAYHAGLSPDVRSDVQSRFIGGDYDVIVATNAFGMGIDKADVRCVIHLALPGSIEAYYQEIGRAGRDGAPSRAVTLFSYGDKRLHEHFLERDYPALNSLSRVHAALRQFPASRSQIAQQTGMNRDVVGAALAQLVVHGGADVLGRGPEAQHEYIGADFKEDYEYQCALRTAELEDVLGFAEGGDCRMAGLIGYFGDKDAGACGHCDNCAPQEAVARSFRKLDDAEEKATQEIVAHLDGNGGRGISTGRLFTDLKGQGFRGDRDGLTALVVALCRARVLESRRESFEKDGRNISYQSVRLGDVALDHVELVVEASDKRRASSSKRGRVVKGLKAKAASSANAPDDNDPLFVALKAWRTKRCKAEDIAAYRVLTNQTLFQIVADKPASSSALMQISGIGEKKLELYGEDIVALVNGAPTA